MAQEITALEKGSVVDEKVNRMGTGSIPKLLAEFAIPAIVGMVVNGLYNIIAAVFLGQAMGPIGLATTTVAMPIMTVFMAIAMLVGNGGNALAALRLGEGRKDEAERTLGNTVTLCVIFAVVIGILAQTPLIGWLLTVSGATPDDWDYARQFIQVISLGFIFQCIGMGVNNFIRTAGAPNRALLTIVIGAVSCTAFCWLFVSVLNWGVVGAALATICGQAISCASVLWYFTITKGVPMRLRRSCLALRGSVVRMIISLGLASFAMQAGMAVVNFVLNNLLNTYGAMTPIGAEGALASIGVVQRIAMFVVFPLIGIAVANQPLLGFNYGARLYSRVRKALFWAAGSATVTGVILWALVHIFSTQIVGLFGIDNEGGLMEFTVFAMEVQLIMIPLVGFQTVGSNYFQATGQPVKSIFLSLTRQIIFLIPLYILLPQVLPVWFPQLTGLDAIYFTVPIADFLSVFTTAIFIVFELRRLRKLERGEIAPKF